MGAQWRGSEMIWDADVLVKLKGEARQKIFVAKIFAFSVKFSEERVFREEFWVLKFAETP